MRLVEADSVSQGREISHGPCDPLELLDSSSQRLVSAIVFKIEHDLKGSEKVSFPMSRLRLRAFQLCKLEQSLHVTLWRSIVKYLPVFKNLPASMGAGMLLATRCEGKSQHGEHDGSAAQQDEPAPWRLQLRRSETSTSARKGGSAE
jgi:hypothetical protein